MQAAFPNLIGVDNAAYYDWLIQHGRYEIPIPRELLPLPATEPVQKALDEPEKPSPGVIITGYFRAELGTGQSGRLIAAAVEASGEKYCTRI